MEKVNVSASTRRQYLTVFTANILAICYGMSMSWASPVLPVLISDKSPLPYGSISVDDAANIGALYCLGGALGTILYGFITDYFGRKIGVLSCAFPYIICWTMKIFSTAIWQLLLARFILGLSSGGVFVVIPLFVAEMADDRIRGFLGSLFTLSNNIGIALGYIAGGYMEFYVLAYLLLALPIIFIILFYKVPETPMYLISRSRYDEANNSTLYYRGQYIDPSDKLQYQEKCDSDYEKDKGLSWNDFKTPASKKGIIILTVTLLTTALCGMFTINVYMATIFAVAKTNIDPNLATIFVSILQISGTCVSSALVEKAGRRILLLISSFLTGLSLIVIAGYMFLKELNYEMTNLSWLPIAAVASYMFNASWGVLPIPYILAGEIVSIKIRGTIASIGLVGTWIIGIIFMKYFHVLLDVIGLHGSMLFFGGVCLCETIFVVFYVPETKGKSLAEIECILGSKNK